MEPKRTPAALSNFNSPANYTKGNVPAQSGSKPAANHGGQPSASPGPKKKGWPNSPGTKPANYSDSPVKGS